MQRDPTRPCLAVLAAAALAAGAVLVPPAPALAEDSLVRPGKRRPGADGGSPVRPGKQRPGGAPVGATKAGGAGERPARDVRAEERARAAALVERYLGILERQPGETAAMGRLTEIYRTEHGTLDGLVQQLETRVENEPGAFAPLMILGELYRRSARPEDALRLFRAAADARQGDAAPHLAASRVAEELGDLEAAGAGLEAALDRSRGADRADALRGLRDLLLRQGELDGARRRHDELVRASGSGLYVRLELGQALARLERHREAVAAFEEVARQVRGDPRARVPVLRELARSQVALGEEEAALETLRTALRASAPGTGERAELHEMLADVYRRRDDLRGLVSLLEAEPGGGFERAELLGRLTDELGEATRAERWYRAALGASARDVDTRVRLIRLLVRQGRVEEAAREYETLVRLAPREPRFVTELAEMYLRLGERDRALGLLARVGRQNPRDVALHSALLEIYGSWGEEALALEQARTLTRIDPLDESHLVDLGERYHQSGDAERALATWRRIPHVARERWQGLAALADVYADHEMVDEALGLYEEALRLRPDDVGVLRRLASLLERQGQLARAVERWERVIAVSGEQDDGVRREARTRIVTIWAHERSLPRRVPELRRRFSAEPPDLEAGRFLYEALLRLGGVGDAVDVMRRIVALRPGDVETHLALERALVRQGDLEGAMDVLRALLELAPRRSRELLERLASHAMALRREDEALDYASRALALNPDDAQGHLRLAQLHLQQGRGARAVADYARALELDDRLFDAYLQLAELHETRSETAEAVRIYVRLLAKAPDDAMVARAGRQALLLAVMNETVTELEDDLLPMALAHTERPVYRRVLVALYANMTWPLVQAAAHGDAVAAAAARERLGAVGRRSLQPLLDALLDADPDQQEAAVSMLGHLGNPSAAVPLLAYATGAGGPPALRARALLAAGQLGDGRIARDLAGILASHGDPAMVEAAAYGLGRVATSEAVAALVAQVGSPSPSVRALVCIGLGRSGQPARRDLLVDRLERDPSPIVRAAAAWALGRLPLSTRSSAALVQTMRAAPPQVRRAAAWALGAAGEEATAREMAWALFDEDAGLREVGAWALRRAGRGPLTGASDDAYHRLPNGQLRTANHVDDLLGHRPGDGSAATAFARGGPALDAALEAALGGGRSRTDRAAVALRAFEPAGSGRVLLAPLVEPEELEEETVRAGMVSLSVVLLRRSPQLLRHPRPSVRGLAATALGAVGGIEAARALATALDDEDPGVREIAIERLARLGTDEAVEALSERLSSAEPSTVALAARALGMVGGERAVAALLELLERGGQPGCRVAAILALASHLQGDAALARALAATAGRDPDPRVRLAACDALAAASPPGAAPAAACSAAPP